MKINLKSTVQCPIILVQENFDENLFKYLLPPGAQLMHYGGSKKGDIVHLKLPLVGTWKSAITDHGEAEDQIFFVDEGVQLPFPLKRWKHRHVLHKKGEHTVIKDHMDYSTGFVLSDALVYPFLLLAFAPRVRQYKKYFFKINQTS